jgi:hypothetical protein
VMNQVAGAARQQRRRGTITEFIRERSSPGGLGHDRGGRSPPAAASSRGRCGPRRRGSPSGTRVQRSGRAKTPRLLSVDRQARQAIDPLESSCCRCADGRLSRRLA